MQIKISDAKVGQIEAFARIALGLDTTDAKTRAKLLALLAACDYTKDYIEIDDDEPTPQPRSNVEVEDILDGKVDKKRKVRIMIPATPEPGGDEPFPVLVNGRRLDIPRGEIVSVPVRYVHAIENMRGVSYDPSPTGGLVQPRVTQAVPFNIYPDE